MSISDDLLSAYLDGELSGDDLARVEQALANDPAIIKRYDELRRSDEIVNMLASTIDDEPMPEDITRLLDQDSDSQDSDSQDSGKVIPFARPESKPAARRWALPLAASIALAVGFVGGGISNPFGVPGSEPEQLAVISEGDRLFALLNDTASGELIDVTDEMRGEVRLTFSGQDGQFCREFWMQSGNQATQNIACREESGAWQIELTARAAPKSEKHDGFETAAAGDEAFGMAVSQMMAGDAIDSGQEQALIDSAWSSAR